MEIGQELCQKIDKYIKEGNKRTLHQLSRKCGIPYATVRRIASGEGGAVGMETSLKLLRVLDTVENVMDFCRRHFGESGGYLFKFYENLAAKGMSSVDIDRLFDEFGNWVIISMANNEWGVSESEVIKIVGIPKAKAAIENLDEMGLLEFKDNKIFCKTGRFQMSTVESSLKQVRHCTELFDEKDFDKPGHHLGGMLLEFSDDALNRVKGIYRNADLEVAEMGRDTRFRGKNLVFTGTICGVFPRYEGV